MYLVLSASYDAFVVKASGLVTGKGVVVCDNIDEACAAVDNFLGDNSIVLADNKIVIEEKLSGVEVSVSFD